MQAGKFICLGRIYFFSYEYIHIYIRSYIFLNYRAQPWNSEILCMKAPDVEISKINIFEYVTQSDKKRT